MPLPPGVPTVTVTTGQPIVLPDGTPAQGKIRFVGPDLITIGADDLVLGGATIVDLVDGMASVHLVPNDVPGMSPAGWAYRVDAQLTNAPNWSRFLLVPSGTSPLVLADVLVPDPVLGNYVTVTGPAGPAGPAGAAGATGLQGPQGPPGPAGGGSSIRTAELLIARENIILPSSPSAYTIMRTSVGDGSFPIACSIHAAAGDRVRWSLSWMRTGGVLFYDVALLNSSGGFSRFASTHGPTPALEGYPAYYNQEASFPGIAGDQQFVIDSSEIDGSGRVTFALAYKGTTDGSQRAYFSADYPGYWLLTNLGPEPA